jgi:hypothetical protein
MPSRGQELPERQERGVNDKSSANDVARNVSGQGAMRRQVTDAGEDASTEEVTASETSQSSHRPSGEIVPPQGLFQTASNFRAFEGDNCRCLVSQNPGKRLHPPTRAKRNSHAQAVLILATSRTLAAGRNTPKLA